MNLLVIDRSDSWHVNDLLRAAGNTHNLYVADYNQLVASFTADSAQPTTFLAGQPIDAFDAILTRAMPASSLQQIVFRMDVLNQIERQLGLPVINPAKTIETCVDKYLSLELLRQFELPVPATHVCQTTEEALKFFESMANKTVLKPLFGSQGRGIKLLDDVEDATSQFQALESAGDVIYQQQFIEHGDWDIRILVVGGVLFAIKRSNPGHWVTNASRGAECTAHEITPLERELAMSASHSQNAFLVGVDIVYDRDQPFIVEANACPSWKHLSAAVKPDVSAEVLYMIDRLAGNDPL